MSNDLLPALDIVADRSPPSEQAPAGGAAARVRADFALVGKSRPVVTSYFARPVVGGGEAAFGVSDPAGALGGGSVLEVRSPLRQVLLEAATAIERIETNFPNGDLASPEVHAAIETVQDVAMALRQRDVEEALCDALDRAIREIGAAIVSHDAAATNARTAAAHVRQLAQHVRQAAAIAANLKPSEPVASGARLVADATAVATSDISVGNREPMADLGSAVVAIGARDEDNPASLLPAAGLERADLEDTLRGGATTVSASALDAALDHGAMPKAAPPAVAEREVAPSPAEKPLDALRRLSDEELIALFT